MAYPTRATPAPTNTLLADLANDLRLLTAAEVEGLIPALTQRRLTRMREAGRGPRYVRAGRSPLYRPADLQAWIEQGGDATRVDTTGVAS